MQYDYILMNPPYDLGGSITTSSKSLSTNTVCLMPLSQYKKKSNELWRYVKYMELADPKMFQDADITGNLCICVLQKDICDVFKSFEDMTMLSFDTRYSTFYKKNNALPLKYVFHRCDNAKLEDFNFNTDIVEGGRLVDADTGISGSNGMGYKINVLKQYETKLNACLTWLHCPSEVAKDNLVSFLYKTDKRWNKVLFGLNMKTTAESASIAIPQIDWEAISDHPLWKEGEYDNAVLSVMGLKWDGDKIVGL